MANHRPPSKPFAIGNKAASVKGRRAKKTIIFDVLGQERIDALIMRAYKMAMDGDAQIMKVLLDKVAPTLKSQDIAIIDDDGKTEYPTLEQCYDPNFQLENDDDVIDDDSYIIDSTAIEVDNDDSQ